jgi:hypothetical protein
VKAWMTSRTVSSSAATRWAIAVTGERWPATYRRDQGVRSFHGCYSLGDDQLWGVVRTRRSGADTLAMSTASARGA